MNSALNQLMGQLGVSDDGGEGTFFSDAQIDKALGDAFVKFDRDGSGWLGFTEFARAWEDLGLGSAEDEIMKAYYKVDTDRSGSIDQVEFMEAIKGEKMDELNMNLLFSKMGDELGIVWKEFASKKDRYKKFEMTATRRRLMKQKMQEDMENKIKDQERLRKEAARQKIIEDERNAKLLSEKEQQFKSEQVKTIETTKESSFIQKNKFYILKRSWSLILFSISSCIFCFINRRRVAVISNFLYLSFLEANSFQTIPSSSPILENNKFIFNSSIFSPLMASINSTWSIDPDLSVSTL
jgi:hypothetical protein